MSVPTATTTRPPGKAGRNLPVAIGVGVALGALILASLFLVRWGWLVLVIPALCIGVVELSRAFASGRFTVPLVPVLLGTVAMHLGAFFGRGPGLMVAFGATLLGIVAWRSVLGIDGATRDVTAHFPSLGRTWRRASGQSLRTEISRKFDPALLTREVDGHGFTTLATWTDPAGDYSLTLHRAE